MSELYKVVGPCEVAGVAPGGTVTREQVDQSAGPDGVIRFEALLGVHLEPVGEEQAKPELKKGAK